MVQQQPILFLDPFSELTQVMFPMCLRQKQFQYLFPSNWVTVKFSQICLCPQIEGILPKGPYP